MVLRMSLPSSPVCGCGALPQPQADRFHVRSVDLGNNDPNDLLDVGDKVGVVTAYAYFRLPNPRVFRSRRDPEMPHAQPRGRYADRRRP